MQADPSRRFDPRFEESRFEDPRHGGDGFEALPTMAKFEAMHRYRTLMVAFFRAPMDAAGRLNMAQFAREARENFVRNAHVFRLSRKRGTAALRKCTAKRAARVCVEGFVLEDFFEMGLVEGSYALDVNPKP